MPHLPFNNAPSAGSNGHETQPSIILHAAPGNYKPLQMIVSNLI